ncbi:MAG TPA: DUF5063 domain-containing protein [Bacteroidales bacterium]|nr:MAG: hypothetical protein A2W98_00545 [Bacteroidetes bacterium GWF2_33_38]OFY71738.1 MAG: hypothetical protein A2265_02850 [Bacteroidetes bacterium RIFOXYA12_FULL_33_9]OFY90213.1 MAG: hypothetical protein A2236_02700 [Bacteroidetes bacterium RIFOXYA2_FULL_33_7]HBF88232.1 DUF5063 domain-containing protein [Bacteroidales bacterium]
MEEYNEVLYSKNVIEFVTVAKEYCLFVEDCTNKPKSQILASMQKFLPLLYLKASMLPALESINDEGNEKFVSETHWNKINTIFSAKFGDDDTYRDIFDTTMNELNESFTLSISEDFTDIYQDLKDFISLFSYGTSEIMLEALWECRNNFEIYWGHRVLSALRAIHLILYKK